MLMTNRKNPSVTMMKGIDRIVMTGLTHALTTVKTAPARISVQPSSP
jgi:hypothetical protein